VGMCGAATVPHRATTPGREEPLVLPSGWLGNLRPPQLDGGDDGSIGGGSDDFALIVRRGSRAAVLLVVPFCSVAERGVVFSCAGGVRRVFLVPLGVG